MVGFVLNGFVFVLIGLRAAGDPRGARRPLAGRDPRPRRARIGGGRRRHPVRLGLHGRASCPDSPRQVIARRDPRLAWRLTFVVSWAGLRGAVSLAAALALPADFPGAEPHPAADVRGHPRHARRPGADAAARPATGRLGRRRARRATRPTFARATAYQAGLDEVERARARLADPPAPASTGSSRACATAASTSRPRTPTRPRSGARSAIEHEEIQRGVIARPARGGDRAPRPAARSTTRRCGRSSASSTSKSSGWRADPPTTVGRQPAGADNRAMSMLGAETRAGSWQPLPDQEWQPTIRSLHRWSQVVGKVRLALATPLNHWWHVPLYVSARGLTTSPIPYGGGLVEFEFDLIENSLTLRSSEGSSDVVPLRPDVGRGVLCRGARPPTPGGHRRPDPARPDRGSRCHPVRG